MKHASFFSGIGGFDLAAQLVGWDNIFQVEKDEWCQRVLTKNFPNVKRYRDIREFNGTGYRGTIDVISGGFPCQPFSVAGKQGGKEDDRYLWPEMRRGISEIMPPFVVGENVAGIINMELDTVLSDLENLGYTTETFVIPACAVNAPHRRDRVWIIGYTEHAGFNGSKNGEGSNTRSNRDQEGQKEICEPTGPTLSRDSIENTNGLRCNGSKRKEEPRERGFGKFSAGNDEQIHKQKIVTNSNIKRQSRPGQLGGQLHSEQSEERQINRVEHDSQFQSNWFEVASELCRVDDGLSHRVDRIKGLGNAIVPQVAVEIFKAINKTLDV